MTGAPERKSPKGPREFRGRTQINDQNKIKYTSSFLLVSLSEYGTVHNSRNRKRSIASPCQVAYMPAHEGP